MRTGSYLTATFSDGELVGEVSQYDENNNRIYVGEVDDDFVRDGQGKFYWTSTDGTLSGDWYEGGFEKLKLSGRGTYHYSDGCYFTAEWKEDKVMSPVTVLDKDGQPCPHEHPLRDWMK